MTEKIIGFDLDALKDNLRRNNMVPYYCDTVQQALLLVTGLIPGGSVVASGGSQTLKQTGIIDYLQNKSKESELTYLDRSIPGLTKEQIEQVYRGAFSSDFYLMSTNALTQSGELYNVDGNSNRVAALLYGPKSVIVVAGVNKIVKDINEAVDRVRRIAAPLNTVRLKTGSYCESTGHCLSADRSGALMCDGCRGDGRICCNYVVSAQQRIKDRIKVVIVGEELGF